MPQKAYIWILKSGIALSFISVLIVASGFLFPYISGKQLYFNILIEILVVFWLAFIIKYPQWNPFKAEGGRGVLARLGGGITAGLMAYFLVILISAFAGVDFNLSFWGDIERMLGFFHVIHFLFLYLIIITVMRDWRDWQFVLTIFLAVATIVALTGLFGSEDHGTVGNTAYMAGFMIFGMFYAILAFLKTQGLERWLYLLPILVMFPAFVNADISGAFAGLGAGFLVFLFFFGILTSHQKFRLISLGLLILIVGGGLFAFTNKEAPVVRSIKPIQDFSWEARTFQTRLISWQAAWEDFSNHPILGTGYGTFAITFDKHFPAEFYDLTRGGTFFDRAHNNLIDIASTTGLLGLIAYLSIFLAFVIYLVRAYRRGRVGVVEVSLILALGAAYLVQNLAVFDSLPTYIGLMLMLGYAYYLNTSSKDNSNSGSLISVNRDRKLIDREIYAFVGVGLLMLFLIFQYNFKTMRMLDGVIESQRVFASGDIVAATAVSQEAFSYNSPLERDGRDSYVKALTRYSQGLPRLDPGDRREVLEYAVELSRKNLAYNQESALLRLRMAQTLNLASRHFFDLDPELAEEYHQEALEHIDKAIEASPERIKLHTVKSQILLTRNQVDEAEEVLKEAISLNDKYDPAVCQLAELYLTTDQEDLGQVEMERCLNLDGSDELYQPVAIKKAINHYVVTEEFSRLKELYQRLARLEGNDPEVWIKKATMYYQMGEFGEAERAARRAAQLNPALEGDMQEFIEQIREAQSEVPETEQ